MTVFQNHDLFLIFVYKPDIMKEKIVILRMNRKNKTYGNRNNSSHEF